MRMSSTRCCCVPPPAEPPPLLYTSGHYRAIVEYTYDQQGGYANNPLVLINPNTGRTTTLLNLLSSVRVSPPPPAFWGQQNPGSLTTVVVYRGFELLHRITTGRNRKFTINYGPSTVRPSYPNWQMVGTDWRPTNPINAWTLSWWDTSNSGNYYPTSIAGVTTFGEPIAVLESRYFLLTLPDSYDPEQFLLDRYAARITGSCVNRSGNKVAFVGDECHGYGGYGNMGILSLDNNGNPTGMTRVTVGPRPDPAFVYNSSGDGWKNTVEGGASYYRALAWQVEAVGDEGWIVSYAARARPAYTASTRGNVLTRLDANGNPTAHIHYTALTFIDGTLGIIKPWPAWKWDDPSLPDLSYLWMSQVEMHIRNFAISLDNEKLFFIHPVETSTGKSYLAAYVFSTSLSFLSAKVLKEYQETYAFEPHACSIVPHPSYPEGIAITAVNLDNFSDNYNKWTYWEGRRLDTLDAIFYSSPNGANSRTTNPISSMKSRSIWNTSHPNRLCLSIGPDSHMTYEQWEGKPDRGISVLGHRRFQTP